MATNRFERYTPLQLQSDYYIPKEIATPDFDMWGKLLMQQQQQYNQLGTLKNQQIDHEFFDNELAKQIHEDTTKKIDNVVNVYKSGQPNSINLGNKALQELATEISQDMNSGNRYYLKTKKEQYNKLKDDFLKSNQDSPKFFIDYGLNQLMNSTNPNELKPIVWSGIGKYYDVEKDLREASKFLQSDEVGTISIGNQYINKTETKGYSKEKIDALFNQIYNDPKYKASIQSQAWDRVRNISPEQYINNKVSQLTEQLTESTSNLSLLEESLKSKDKHKKQAAQKVLKEAGYDIGKDGGVSAFNMFRQAVNTSNNELKSSIEKLPTTELNQIKQMAQIDALKQHRDLNYKGFNSLFGHSIKRDVEINPVYKLSMQGRNLMDAVTKITEQMVLPPNPGIFTPDVSEEEKRQWGSVYSNINTGLQQADKTLTEDRTKLNKNLGLKFTPEVQAELQEIYAESVIPGTQGKIDKNKFNGELAKRGNWWTSTFSNKVDNLEKHYNTTDGQNTLLTATSRKQLLLQKEATEGIYDAAIKDNLFQDAKIAPVVDKYYQKFKKEGQSKEDFTKEILAAKDAPDNRFNSIKLRGSKTGTVEDKINEAKNFASEVNKVSSNQLDKVLNKTILTNRYVQPDKSMPMGMLSQSVEKDFVAGNSYGYGIDGRLTWLDSERKEQDLPVNAALTNVSVETIRSDMGNKYRITGDYKGKRYTALSDIPPQHKEMNIQAARSEALMMFENGEQDKGFALSRKALIDDHGMFKMPNLSSATNSLNVNSKYNKVPIADGTSRNVDVVISNKPLSDIFNIKGMNLYVKATGEGSNTKYVVVTKGSSGEAIVPLRYGKIQKNMDFEFNSVNQALNEISALAAYMDENAKVKTETIKKSRVRTSNNVSASALIFNQQQDNGEE
jgi:hypothetical protein